MYSEIAGMKIEIEEIQSVTKNAFNLIAKGGKTFDANMMNDARKQHHEIFEFLDEPTKLMYSSN